MAKQEESVDSITCRRLLVLNPKSSLSEGVILDNCECLQCASTLVVLEMEEFKLVKGLPINTDYRWKLENYLNDFKWF